jgi:hypothetical protein
MKQKIGILVVLASILLSTALIATPSLKVANAQGNETKAQGLPVDAWIKALKDKHPDIANVEQDPKVKAAIAKIKGMTDPKEAVDTFNALQTLVQLMNLKAAQEGQ